MLTYGKFFGYANKMMSCHQQKKKIKKTDFCSFVTEKKKTLYNYLKKYCSSVGSSGILFVICAVFPKQMGLVCMYFFISIYVQILWCSSSLRLFVCMFQWFLHTGFLVSAVMVVVERGPEVKYVFFCVCMCISCCVVMIRLVLTVKFFSCPVKYCQLIS